MKYIINFSNGSIMWKDNIDIPTMVSLISNRVVVSVINVEEKTALILSFVDDKDSPKLGWADIPEFADKNQEGIENLL